MTSPDALLPRPLDQAEAFFWLLDRHSSMNFCVIAEGHGRLSTATLAKAVRRVQQRHPLLTVAIERNALQQLTFVPAPDLHAEIEQQNLTSNTWRAALAKAMVKPFPLDRAPLFRVHFYRLPKLHWVLALSLHHSIGDAHSCFSVLAEILQQASSAMLAHPPGTAHLPRPPLLTLYPAEFTGAEGAQRAESLRALKRSENKSQGMPDSLPGYLETAAISNPDFSSLHYSAELVQQILKRVHAAKTTLHGFLGAAQLLALRQFFSASEKPLLCLTSPADLRQSLVPAMDAATPGFYVTLISPTFRVGDADSFWSLAHDITEQNRLHLNRGDGHLLYQLLPKADDFTSSEAGVSAFSQMMLRGPQSSLLSNAGIIPPIKSAAGIVVDDLSFCLCPAPKQTIFTSATTYAGHLTLNITFDHGRLPAPLPEMIRERMDYLIRTAALL